MKQRLGEFELLEQIDPGGYTVVWRAVQHMGHGVSRPAAVKILQGWKADDPEQIAALRKEVSVLADLSTCPNIVTIYGFDIDPEVGPWIAMELGGQSLRHFISEDKPGDPAMVRQLLRDVLRALIAVHGVKPPVLHRDLKPNNILSTGVGTWKLADFGLAKRSETESTLNVLTVQYAAPELLDASLGREGPWTDLYSLGLSAYELALGRKAYRAQFPSIYDPYASSEATRVDERPKWMYWHTSRQMTVKPLAELLPDFPKDLSDLIADMIRKPVEERLASASEAMARIQETGGSAAGRPSIALTREDLRKKQGGGMALVAAAAAVLLVVVSAGAWLLLEITSRPVLVLEKGGSFKTETGTVTVSGHIRNMPARGTATLLTGDKPASTITVDSRGRFSAEVKLDKLGETTGRLRVTEGKVRLIDQPLRLERLAPKAVRIVVATEPPTPDAQVQFIAGGPDAKPVVVRTGADGRAEAPLPYGRFELRIEHPRFATWQRELETGADPERSFKPRLEALPEAAVRQKRLELLSRLDSAAAQAATGSAEALRDIASVRSALALLDSNSNDADARRRLSLAEELLDVAKRAAAGDERALARLSELRAEASELARNIGAALGSERRQALMARIGDAMERALRGETAAADSIRALREEVRALDAQEGAGAGETASRARLIGQIGELASRAARGDSEAGSELRAAFRQLQEMGAPSLAKGSSRRQSVMEDLARGINAVVAGDAAALQTVRQARERIVQLDRDERVAASIASKRARLLGDIADLAERASRGDVQSARGLRELERQLVSLDVSSAAESALVAARDPAALQRRAALVRELGEAVAGLERDPRMAKRLREIRTQLQSMEVGDGTSADALTRRRIDLLTELAEVIDLAGSQDQTAVQRLSMIHRELATLVAVDLAAGDAGAFAEAVASMIGSNPSLSLIDRATLLQLPEADFRAFIEAVVPSGVLAVESVPNLRRLRVRGSVLTDRELSLLNLRLDPASPRLMMEVRVDPWAVCRRLEERLAEEGFTGVRVHPYLAARETTLFVQFRGHDSPDEERRARAAASTFVIDQDTIFIQPYRAEKPARAAPAAAPRTAAH